MNELQPLPPGSTKVRLVVDFDGETPVIEISKALASVRAKVVGVTIQEVTGDTGGSDGAAR